MLSQMMTWAQSDDEHLRRLASEGADHACLGRRAGLIRIRVRRADSGAVERGSFLIR